MYVQDSINHKTQRFIHASFSGTTKPHLCVPYVKFSETKVKLVKNKNELVVN